MDLRTRAAIVGRLFSGYPAHPQAARWLASTPDVTVARDAAGWSFSPAAASGAGLILYPGARVDNRAYAGLAARVAAAGYFTEVLAVPGGMALIAPGKAAAVMDAHPEIERWIVAGHSLGGTAAARFVFRNPGRAAGLLLLAAYSAPGDDLSAAPVACTSVRATVDTVLNADRFEAGKARLPAATRYVDMEGGNHAGFGDYGPQAGDGVATLSRDQQLDAVAALAIAMLRGD